MRDSLRPLAAAVDVEAVLQEALLRVWQVAPRFVPDGRPDGLLRLGGPIAGNVALDEARGARAAPADGAALEALGDALAARADAPDPLLRRSIAECRARLGGPAARALEARLASAGADP